jgi:para-nitrobenzyl esterase
MSVESRRKEKTMKLARLGAGLAAMIAVMWSGIGQAEPVCAEPVKTGSGLVRGAEEETTCVWKGVPFAAAPVGDKRWKAPEKMPEWSGVREAKEFGHRCMQKGVMAAEGLASKEGMSEDCLFLNVWRPKKSGTFPVMVWVHGGGYYGGSGGTPWYWGDRLAQNGDLVVVTINYRLNIFGFLAHPALRAEDPHGSTGSYGTLDQVAALQWVHDNIANFGGDPGNVTIFGESAGGWSICTLVATPLTKGLFHRALLESGGCTQSGPLEEGYEQTRKVSAQLGCGADDLTCLRKLSAKKVLDKGSGGMGSGVNAKPHHDGYVLTDTPLAMIKSGNYNHVPFIAGSNRDEFANMLRLFRRIKRIQPEAYEDALVKQVGLPAEEAKKLVALYPLAEFGNRPVLAYGRMFGADASLACPTFNGLQAAAAQQSDTYYYRFDYDEMKASKYTGAAHAMEIPFIFANLDRMPASVFYNKKNIGPATELSRVMQGYVINFAKTGDPNGPGLPAWPKFAPDTRRIQVLDTTVRTEPAGEFGQRCDYWAQTKMPAGDSMSAFDKKKGKGPKD